MSKKCSVEGCDGKMYCKSYCESHYRKFKRHGDPLYIHVRKKPKCLIDGCSKLNHSKGYCSLHSSRLKKHGDPLYEKKQRKCSVNGCEKMHSAKGYCITHYRRFKEPKPKGECIIDGCVNQIQSLNYCSKHYNRLYRHNDPFCVSRIEDGRSKHYLYRAYKGMIERCQRKHHQSYDYYGGRGITVCARWLEPNGKGFWNFISDMGDRPKGMTLDRINNDGNYEPSNCKWATREEQSTNQRARSISVNNKSGFKGVFLLSSNKWRADITYNRVRYHLGIFDRKEDAIGARKKAEELYFG